MSVDNTPSWNVVAALDELAALGAAADRVDVRLARLRADMARIADARPVAAERFRLPMAFGLWPVLAAAVLLLLI